MPTHLGTIDNDGIGISFGKIIMPDIHDKMKKSINAIREFNQNKELLYLVLLNNEDIDNFIKSALTQLTEKSTRWNGVTDADLEKLVLELNRFFLNYLSSIRTYLDHSETYLKRKFGDISQQWKEYSKFRSSIYDNSFAYRFFYLIRNFAQHCELPLENMGYMINRKPNTDKIEVLINPIFFRDNLLMKFDWKKIKSELLNLPPKIELNPLLSEVTKSIKAIHEEFIRIDLIEINESINYVNGLTKHLKKENNKVCLFADLQLSEDGNIKGNTINIEYVPHNIIDAVLNKF